MPSFNKKQLIFFCNLVSLRPKRRLEGPAWAPGGFNFFFLPSMNTTKVSIFSATIFVNTTQSSNNNQWNPGHKNKKIWAVYHEIRHWWYFGPIWFFFWYWIRLRYNVILITIFFFSSTAFSLPKCLGKRNLSLIRLKARLSLWKITK